MRTNFTNLLAQPLEIPIIQRDYAQGRKDHKTNKIRKDFLDAIFDFLINKQGNPEAQIELDFIYGFTKQSSFIPIDGQQRLTTLWLLYWFVGAKEKVSEDALEFLGNFSYETRHSTTQFCSQLIRFIPQFEFDCISNEIKDQSWYLEVWDFDPSIQAMLVMLDDIENRYNTNHFDNLWASINVSSSPFYFYKLDMDSVGLTDDLYIKMNSRGKGLTEFEYFKAGFSDIINDENLKKRFDINIDGIWMDTIWQMVYKTQGIDDNEDISLKVDDAFLRLFNFISSVLSLREDIRTVDGIVYQNTEVTPELLPIIYGNVSNVNYLFETLDAICEQELNDSNFWDNLFYHSKEGFEIDKIRLFFQGGDTNLLLKCIYHHGEPRRFSYPEQLLLLGCLSHFRTRNEDFINTIRTVRNMAINSEFQLRESVMGKAFQEVEAYLESNDLDVFDTFKTDQINEEKEKYAYLQDLSSSTSALRQIEDSDLLRGSIAIFPFDNKLPERALKFLELFDEVDITQNFISKSNLLLCFGDYTQDEDNLTNMMAPNRSYIRSFFTMPGYNKEQIKSKTRTVLLACLDYFIENPSTTPIDVIENSVMGFENKAKDWRYYFIKYPSFRYDCHYGYYAWLDDNYCFWKLGKKQFNGYHWDAFSHEIAKSYDYKNLSLSNYGNYEKLILTQGNDKVLVSTLPEGFKFENASTGLSNKLLETLTNKGVLDIDNILRIDQNDEGLDLEDRIAKLKMVIDIHIFN